jgi:RES domain-containing protein
MFLWRIGNHADLKGRGGLLASARWHTQGRPIVYLAESPSGALTEVLVHLELDAADLPGSYKLLKVEVPDKVAFRNLKLTELSKNWRNNLVLTRTIGDEWLASAETALFRVPSAIVPETFNVLLNPLHRDAAELNVLWHRQYPWDRRLFEQG